MNLSTQIVHNGFQILSFVESVEIEAIEQRRIEFLTKTTSSYTVGHVQLREKYLKIFDIPM